MEEIYIDDLKEGDYFYVRTQLNVKEQIKNDGSKPFYWTVYLTCYVNKSSPTRVKHWITIDDPIFDCKYKGEIDCNHTRCHDPMSYKIGAYTYWFSDIYETGSYHPIKIYKYDDNDLDGDAHKFNPCINWDSGAFIDILLDSLWFRRKRIDYMEKRRI